MSRLTEPVVLVEYRDEWRAIFMALEVELIAGLSGLNVLVEHIGSTAVPGLAAKPTLDVMLGVEDAVDLALLPARLAVLGFEYQPEHEKTMPFRRFFVRRNGAGERMVHVHAVVPGGGFWRDYLVFRDALRADAGLRRSYERLKAVLAASCGADREAYTRGKAVFVSRVLRESRVPDR